MRISRFDFGNFWRRSNNTVLSCRVVTVDSTVLGVKGTLKNPASNSFAAEHPGYEGTVGDVFATEVNGNCTEELEFIRFETVRV